MMVQNSWSPISSPDPDSSVVRIPRLIGRSGQPLQLFRMGLVEPTPLAFEFVMPPTPVVILRTVSVPRVIHCLVSRIERIAVGLRRPGLRRRLGLNRLGFSLSRTASWRGCLVRRVADALCRPLRNLRRSDLLVGCPAQLPDHLTRVRQRLGRQRRGVHGLCHPAREQVRGAAPGLQRGLLARRSNVGVVEADRRAVNLQLGQTINPVSTGAGCLPP